MIFYSYALVDPRNPTEPRWIGCTKTPKRRLDYHVYVSTSDRSTTRYAKKSEKSRWIRDLMRHGLLPRMVILRKHASREAAEAHKVRLIVVCRKMGNRLFNKSMGGRGPTGTRRSKETVEKMRMANAGNMRAVVCIETGKVYESLRAATEASGVSRRTIRASIKDGWAANGYHYEFAKTKGPKP